MAKAHSPIRLESSLMKSAALAGEAFKRSASEQVEFWASIGRLVAPRMTPNEILELQAGLAQLKIEKSRPVSIDPTSLFAEVKQKRQSGTLEKAIGHKKLRYQASITQPGFLEQVATDGSVTVGRFENGEFKAI